MSLLPCNYDKSLIEHILPTGFIKNGFITEKQNPLNYSYEDYIIEEMVKGTEYGIDGAVTDGKINLNYSWHRAELKTVPQS